MVFLEVPHHLVIAAVDVLRRIEVVTVPILKATVAGIYICGDATASVLTPRMVDEQLAGPGIAHAPAEGRLLVHHHHLQSGAVGHQVAQMERVAVAQAGGVQQAAVVVDGGRPVDNLVAAVTVHIAHRHRVAALSVCRAIEVLVSGAAGDA